MVIEVIKRDGRVVSFRPDKIENAIRKAFEDVDNYELTDEAMKISFEIADKIENLNKETMSVEEIQDIVETELMRTDRKDVAKAYIIYRNERTKIRERNGKLINAVMERANAEVNNNANANVDEASFSGREKEASSDISKMVAVDYGGLSEDIAKAHEEMLIYQHDLEKAIFGIHNCFSRDTKFITTHGIKSFEDFKDGDKINVISHTGKIRQAIVHYYGKQKLYNLTFKRFKTSYTVKATENHRWLLKDGNWTNNINVGDYLYHAPNIFESFNFDKLNDNAKKMWCYGFVMGDGTIIYKYSKRKKEYYKTNETKVTLFGDKIKYIDRFINCGYHLCESKSEDKTITHINFKKEIPEIENLSYEELIAFVHGLYDADGNNSYFSNSEQKMYGIQFSNEKLCSFVETYFESAGLYISRIIDKTGQKTNYGTRGFTKCYSFIPNPRRFNYVLEAKEYIGEEDVWCLEVEEDNSFILHGGIVTGNCLNLNFQEIFKYGFKTRNGDVRPPASFSTACQLYAVAFQCQSQVC